MSFGYRPEQHKQKCRLSPSPLQVLSDRYISLFQLIFVVFRLVRVTVCSLNVGTGAGVRVWRFGYRSTGGRDLAHGGRNDVPRPVR